MLSWISDNLANILACLALGGVMFLSIFLIVRSRRKGKSSCGCSCGKCPMGSCCQSGKGTKKQS